MNNKQRAAQIAEALCEVFDQQDRIEERLVRIETALEAFLTSGMQQDRDEEEPAPSSRPSTTAHDNKASKRKDRNISEATYLRISVKALTSLLRPDAPLVGKLTHVLQKEAQEAHTSFLMSIRKLAERESFIVISEAARGQPSFVRLKDRPAAVTWLSEAKEKYKKMMALDGFEEHLDEEKGA